MKDALAEIKKQVFARRPALKVILDAHGSEPLKDYVSKSWQTAGAAPDEIFLKIFKDETEKLFGPGYAQAAVSQLQKKPLVSTVDHLGICSHPFFVNSDVIFSLAFEKDELGIVLATESVSLNNSSSRSASFLYHENSNLIHHSFFPVRLKNLPVFSAPMIAENDIQRFHKATANKFEKLVQELDMGKTSANNLSAQAAQISNKFWQKVFPSAPKMLYVPLETLISKYLLRVLEDSQDLLYHLVLSKEGRELWQRNFPKEHTFIFWAIDENGKRQALTTLPEDPDDLLQLISRRQIYPASPLCFIVLLKAGLTCAGGFTQTSWLAKVKEKLIAMILEIGKVDTANIKNIATDNFAESSLAWLKSGESYIQPSMVDLFLSGKDFYSEYQALSAKLTLAQSLEMAMPDIYRVVVPKTEQMPETDLSGAQKSGLTALTKLL